MIAWRRACVCIPFGPHNDLRRARPMSPGDLIPAPRSADESPVTRSVWGPVLALLLLALVFWHAGQMPLDHKGTWNHWKYGEWIWQHKRLPAHEPFSPYSDDQRPLLDSSWL